MFEKDYSEIWRMFYGIHISNLEHAKTGEKISMVPEPFFIINLPIPDNKESPSLKDCFDLYVECEILDGDNCVLCEKTGEKVPAKKNIVFWCFPDILVIDIKRFNMSLNKNKVMIDFPLDNLDLSDYVIGYNKDSYIYDLYGVSNHSGTVLSGHYTSFVKNANGKWYHYNDSSVTDVPNLQHIITPNAYCFFYRKQQKK
jgi:ubiquitin carboxyl-terminal hydrolase 8